MIFRRFRLQIFEQHQISRHTLHWCNQRRRQCTRSCIHKRFCLFVIRSQTLDTTHGVYITATIQFVDTKIWQQFQPNIGDFRCFSIPSAFESLCHTIQHSSVDFKQWFQSTENARQIGVVQYALVFHRQFPFNHQFVELCDVLFFGLIQLEEDVDARQVFRLKRADANARQGNVEAVDPLNTIRSIVGTYIVWYNDNVVVVVVVCVVIDVVDGEFFVVGCSCGHNCVFSGDFVDVDRRGFFVVIIGAVNSEIADARGAHSLAERH
mmetsp:Transcript_15239/g.26205  ORF Transcript_15239/g.26205 Transcript_15239/m.26205 type:complete len:265 (-) Transcript_15239:460-1254(-)